MFHISNPMNPIKSAFNNVAWKRTLIICAALGSLSTLGDSKDLDNAAEAIGYFIGATSTYAVMVGGATAACSKQHLA